MTNVTKPSLPPLEKVLPLLEEMWASGVLSNAGPFHVELEAALTKKLGIVHPSLFCNATIALMTAQQALGVKGKVITTPYSFVATSNALRWLGNDPVFVDIEPDSLCLDPEKVEAAITDEVVAIMPLHCYGNVCNTTAISELAKHYGLKVIYDACHSFGVEDEKGSVLRHGDMSAVSFHATKVFNTFEGGMLVSSTKQLKQKVDHLKNFGFVDETTVIEAGLNGKMSEFNAALGLLQLQEIETNIQKRSRVDALYRDLLSDCPGVRCLEPVRQKKRNFAYFPIFIEPDYPLSRDDLYKVLRQNDIYGRRYFYPLISDFPVYADYRPADSRSLAVATKTSESVICLPIYPDLPLQEATRIGEVITASSRQARR